MSNNEVKGYTKRLSLKDSLLLVEYSIF